MKDRLIRFLRWSEKYTKTDMVYLASGGFWLTFEQVLLGLMALAVSVAFAHFVSKDTYGTYRFLLSLFWTLSAFSLTGLAPALSRAIAKGEEGAYRQSISLSLLGTLPMSLIAAAMTLYYFHVGNTTLGWGMSIICLIAPFFQAGYLYGSFLEGKRDFRRATILSVFLSLVPALLLLALMPFARSPIPFFVAYLGGGALTSIVISWVVVRLYRPNRVKSTELNNLSWHLSIVNILSALATQADQLLVFHYLGAIDLAIYSFATAVPDQMKNMITNLSNIAFPKFVNRPISEIRGMLWHRTLIITIGLVVCIVLYILVAPFFFHLLLPAYDASIRYSELYALTLIATASLIPVTVLQAHAAKRELYTFNIVSAIVQIGTMVMGIVLYGLVGLIIARGISRIFNLLLGNALVSSYARRTARETQAS